MNKNAMHKTLAVAMAAIGLAQPALAVLDSAGPVDPVNGYPQWYMDRNGVALEVTYPVTSSNRSCYFRRNRRSSGGIRSSTRSVSWPGFR